MFHKQSARVSCAAFESQCTLGIYFECLERGSILQYMSISWSTVNNRFLSHYGSSCPLPFFARCMALTVPSHCCCIRLLGHLVEGNLKGWVGTLSECVVLRVNWRKVMGVFPCLSVLVLTDPMCPLLWRFSL